MCSTQKTRSVNRGTYASLKTALDVADHGIIEAGWAGPPSKVEAWRNMHEGIILRQLTEDKRRLHPRVSF